MGAKTLIAVPCFDMVHTDFMSSIVALEKTEDSSFTVVKNTLIHTARNVIAHNAIEAGFDRIMWFDSDMKFKPDTLIRLSKRMDEGLEFVCGLYFTRRTPIKPVIYDTLWWGRKDGKNDVGAGVYLDYPKDTLTEIAGAGFGCALVSVDLLKRVGEEYGAPFEPLPQLGEDLSFCWRAMKAGAKLWCDTGVVCGHVGQAVYDDRMYLEQKVGEE